MRTTVVIHRQAATPVFTTRFAPSPTGLLHLGNACSALSAWHAVGGAVGRFLLRIEDIDPVRCRPVFEEALAEDLRWLGLSWPEPIRRQSEHLDDYREALTRLTELGVVYPCFCTRAEIAAEIARSGGAPHGPDGAQYPGTCRRLSALERDERRARGDPHALRLDAAAAAALTGPLSWEDRRLGRQDFDPGNLVDVVLARKDVPTSYHLSVTVDDYLQGITLVVRGEDLVASTPVHRTLQALLDYPEPIYVHHPLLLMPDGTRMAKRTGGLTLRSLREMGLSPAAVRAAAGFPGDL